jgi:hypothetical protein
MNITKKIKTQLMLAVVLCCASMGFAQVVQVPPGCVVVIPGTGGTVGPNPTGFVGNGGIVSMPDPSGGGQFNFSIIGTPTTASWSLSGDISNTNVTPNSSPVQPAAGTFANIFTCNKNLRASESLAPSLSSWARSKGRVRLTFNQGPCTNQTITFDIFKTFTASPLTNVPAIVGPACLKPNTQYTYSVDPIISDNINDAIGIDTYYWSGLPAAYVSAATTYTSADYSSITFTTGASVAPFTLQCCYGRVNPNTADGGPFTAINQTVVPARTTCVTKPLLVAPTQPVFSASTFLSTTATMNVTLNPSACLATGQNTFTLTYPNPAAGQSYAWTCTNSNWTFSPNTTATTTLTVNTQGDNSPQTITLTITGNTCDPAIFNYIINRSFAAPLTIIPTVAGNTCLNSTSSGNTYSIGPNASGNSVVWSIQNPSGLTGITLVNATSPTVTVNTAGTAGGTFTLVATSGTAACNSTNITLPINIRPATPVISGTPCVTRGTTSTTAISCNAVPGATGYTWNLTGAPGWTCSLNCTTNTPTFVPNGTTAGPVTISVTALGANGCNSSASANFTVNYNPVIPTSTVSSCLNVGATNATITVSNPQNFGTYTVSSTPVGITGSILGSAMVGGVIPLTIPNTLAAGSYTLVINHSTTSCTPSVNSANIVVTVGAGITVALTANVPGAGNCDQYTVSGATGASLTWRVNGVVVTSNGTTVNIFGNVLTLCGNNAAPTSVCVTATLSGCTRTACAPTLGTHSAKQSTTTPIEGILIYPNPNDGNFTIEVKSFKETATATLTDMTGKEIGNYTLTKGENKIKNKNLSSGTYIVILQIDGKTESRQVIIK